MLYYALVFALQSSQARWDSPVFAFAAAESPGSCSSYFW